MLVNGERMKKSSRITGLILALVGVMLLLSILGNPRIEDLRGVDIVKLIACGLLFGVGLVGLMGRLALPEK
jgi:hypothetical protein